MTLPQEMSAEERFQELRRRFRSIWQAASSLHIDVDELIGAAKAAARADERVKAWKARGEADMQRIQSGCLECDGTGHGLEIGAVEPTECEYCSEPRALIKDMPLPEAQPVEPSVPKPRVVCLCGSTRFMETFFDEGWRLTLAGEIVLSVGVCKHADHHGGEALGGRVAERLDQLHMRKIDLADYVRVLNVGGYMGVSTHREILYAEKIGKPVEYLEPSEGEATHG